MKNNQYSPKVAVLIKQASNLSEEESAQLDDAWYREDRSPALKRLLDHKNVITDAGLAASAVVPLRYAGANNAVTSAAVAVEAREHDLISDADYRLLIDPWETVMGETPTPPATEELDPTTDMGRHLHW